MTHELAHTDYGNWVSVRVICASAALGVLFAALSVLHRVFLVGAALFLIATVYFLYARRAFSARGGGLQARLWELLLGRLDWSGAGRALDIGCGNGPLVVALAVRHSGGHVTGVDTWGQVWDYARGACERNAQRAGVAGRTAFLEASAAALPFAEGSFDAVVSNNVFHTVREVKDRRRLIQEALRVTKKGGRFAFQDLFLSKALYGDIHELVGAIRGWGVADVAFVDTSASGFVPSALKLPFMVGRLGIIYGTK